MEFGPVPISPRSRKHGRKPATASLVDRPPVPHYDLRRGRGKGFREGLMKYRRFGNTGLVVSEVGFGGIPIQRVGDREADEILRHAFDNGVTFYDTAAGYGTSEERIGKALEKVRDKCVIATKNQAADAKTCRELFERSLARLRTGYVDLFQFHNVATEDRYAKVMAKGGAYEFAAEAKEKGRIRHIGFSSHGTKVSDVMVRSGLFEGIQYPFNLIGDAPAAGTFPEAVKRGMGVIAMKPFGGGAIESAEAAFKFLRQFPDCVPIPGVQTKAELQEVLDIYAEENVVTDEDRAEWQRIRDEIGAVYCRRCGYCMPCPQGVEIATLTVMDSFVRRFPRERMLGEEWMKAAESLDKCVECGECETKCPYHLEIKVLMRRKRDAYMEWRKGAPR